MSFSDEHIRRYDGSTVVYVDDEPDNLTSLEMHLEDVFDLQTYEDPFQALEVVRKQDDISVLLVDQVMPRMTGLELAREAKQIRPTVICVMITGNATKKLAIDAIKNGVFWDFIEKPVDFGSEEMRQKIIHAIQEHLLQKTKIDYRQGTLELLANLIDDKDGHTHRHSKYVTELAVKLGRKLNMTEREIVMIREGSMIHDIGKISIPDDILKKPGRLTTLERKIIMTHAARGGAIIEKIPQLRELACMARDHHERPDGTGYPEGKKIEDISMMTSIVALADFYEALSSRRPYKEPWAIPEIVKEITRNKGTQFRSEVVDALFEVLEDDGLIDSEELEKAIASVAA